MFDSKMNDIGEWIKILGGVAALAVLIWRIIDEFGSYLRIAVKAEEPKEGWVTVLTTVDNKGNRPKNLSYAFLLIGPETEGPLESANVVAPEIGYDRPLNKTNEFRNLRSKAPVYVDGRAFIPLPFYYSENIRIGDETLTYRAPLRTQRLTPGLPYAVRLFVFPKCGYHRSTHDCFLIQVKNEQQNAELSFSSEAEERGRAEI
jgi:hypothetical protein